MEEEFVGFVHANVEKPEWERLDFDLQRFIKNSILIYFQTPFPSSNYPNSDKMQKLLTFFGTRGLDLSRAKYGHDDPTWIVEVCHFLLDLGADINATDIIGCNALYHAVRFGRCNRDLFVEFLLDRNIDFTTNLPEVLTNSAGSPDLTKLLIRRCVDAGSEARSGEVILSLAVSYCSIVEDVLKAIGIMMGTIEYSHFVRVKVNEHLGCSAMIRREISSAWNHWREAVELRIAHGITDGGLPFTDLETFERVANENNLLKMYMLFFDIVGGSIRHLDNTNENLIHLLRHGFDELLFDHHSENLGSIPHGDLLQVSELMLRTYSLNWESLESFDKRIRMVSLISVCSSLLRNAGADEGKMAVTTRFFSDLAGRNLVDSNLESVLHYCLCDASIDESDFKLIELLLECGVDGGAKNRDGRTAYHLYVESCEGPEFSQRVVDLFVQHAKVHIDEKLPGTEKVRICEYLKDKGVHLEDEMKYVSLQCLAARVIADRNLDYDSLKHVPGLCKFIEIH